MPYKYNPWTKKPDYYVNTVISSGPGQISLLSVVFYEEFTGDGGTTEFTLNGFVRNASFSGGGWSLTRVKYALPSNVTNIDNGILYDSSNIFTRDRIDVVDINGSTGVVTLTHPPQALEEFKIWYWYDLNDSDVLSTYRREDYVTDMESDSSALVSTNVAVDTQNFNNILSSSEDTVQKVLDLLDDHEHDIIITDILVDDISLSSFYVGYAKNDATESDPYWQIKRIDEVNDIIYTYYAEGSQEFNKIWDNRALYTYT